MAREQRQRGQGLGVWEADFDNGPGREEGPLVARCGLARQCSGSPVQPLAARFPTLRTDPGGLSPWTAATPTGQQKCLDTKQKNGRVGGGEGTV